jgi:hypothetical protein
MYTQVLADICKQCDQLKRYKAEIMEIFKSNNFFRQTECTIKKWKEIIHHLTTSTGRAETSVGGNKAAEQSVFGDMLQAYE